MRLVRYLAFCVFSAIGISAIAVSILIEPELADYYRNKELLKENEAANEEIKSLISEYEAQIELIKKNPEVLERLKKVTLGEEKGDEGSVYPEITDSGLAQATAALFEDLKAHKTKPMVPQWIQRCREPDNRKVLFGAGAGLILVGFVFFGTTQQKDLTDNETSRCAA